MGARSTISGSRMAGAHAAPSAGRARSECVGASRIHARTAESASGTGGKASAKVASHLPVGIWNAHPVARVMRPS